MSSGCLHSTLLAWERCDCQLSLCAPGTDVTGLLVKLQNPCRRGLSHLHSPFASVSQTRVPELPLALESVEFDHHRYVLDSATHQLVRVADVWELQRHYAYFLHHALSESKLS